MAYVQTEVTDRVAVVTLTDPDRRNALHAGMVEELVATVGELEQSDTAVMIITGAPPAFCAGADLDALEQADGPGLRAIYEGFTRVHRSSIPSIAAINGATVGAGMNLALACDVRLAAERALFDTGFLKLEVHPGGGHTWMLERELGVQATFALALFGDTVTGREAETRGLVWRCVPDEDLLPLAREMASRVAGHPQELLRQLNATIREMVGIDSYTEAVDLEFGRQMWSIRQEAFKEALAAVRAEIASKRAQAPPPTIEEF